MARRRLTAAHRRAISEALRRRFASRRGTTKRVKANLARTAKRAGQLRRKGLDPNSRDTLGRVRTDPDFGTDSPRKRLPSVRLKRTRRRKRRRY